MHICVWMPGPSWRSIVNTLGRAVSSVHVRTGASSADMATAHILKHAVAALEAESASLVTYAPDRLRVTSVH